jgi:oxygen-independent coproporphyrinogen-3 oxidase
MMLTGRPGTTLTSRVPSRTELADRCRDIREFGLYLHIPFCRQICGYCPYHKQKFEDRAAAEYAMAVRREIDSYGSVVGPRPVTSLYIGGGTPTTMLEHGLPGLLEHLRGVFNLRCGVHMESHLNDLSEANLDRIEAMGVGSLSMGVEALRDASLRLLGRPYTAEAARQTVRRVMARGFECVNVDLMFALPGQSGEEVELAARELVDLGVHQVSAYPLFRFPYTRMGSTGRAGNHGLGQILRRRRMLERLERAFAEAGYRRSSVWAFTKAGTPRYCSVTVPLYIGLGASGGSYLPDVFYLNTFSVAEYTRSLGEGRLPIALSVDLTRRMQMAGWLYWRVYETAWTRSDFRSRFGSSFDAVYGPFVRALRAAGFCDDDGDRITLTNRGAYWLHALEDALSIASIGTLWGAATKEPWPQRVAI